jgi:hypothetical protein
MLMIDRNITPKEALAAFFREFHRPRRRPMSWQARIAWYVDTTPPCVVRQALDEMRQFKAQLEERTIKAAGAGHFSFFPQPSVSDPAYPLWIAKLAEALETEFYMRLAQRAGVTVPPDLSGAGVRRRDALASTEP